MPGPLRVPRLFSPLVLGSAVLQCVAAQWQSFVTLLSVRSSFISRPHPDEAAAQGASSSWGMWDRWTAILTIGLITEELLRTHVLAYRCSGPVVKAANRAVLLCSTAYLLELPGLQAFCLCSAVFFVLLELALDYMRKVGPCLSS